MKLHVTFFQNTLQPGKNGIKNMSALLAYHPLVRLTGYAICIGLINFA